MRLQQLLLAVMASAVPIVALAETDNASGRIPEPETLALLAAGVIALLIVKHRRK